MFLLAPTPAPRNPEIDDRHVVVLLEPETGSLCAGAIIGRHAIITAAHCTQGMRALIFVTRDGDRGVALVVDSDTSTDHARLFVRRPFASHATIRRAREGERVTSVGHPLGAFFTRKSCAILMVAENEMFASCNADRGSSGGPLLGEDGAVVGIVSRALLGEDLLIAVRP